MLRKASAILCCLVLACVVLLPAARADEWNEQTMMSFNEPIEIPGSALPAGTYWFVLSNNEGRNVVQIYSKDWSKLDASLLTVPVYRQQSTARTEVEFAERPRQTPEALIKWYYPGRLIGHEFLYPHKVENRLNRESKLDVLAKPLILPISEISGA
jgi:Protein of unknown function (DUF2911)